MESRGLSDKEIIRVEDVQVEMEDWKAAFNVLVAPNGTWDPEDGKFFL